MTGNQSSDQGHHSKPLAEQPVYTTVEDLLNLAYETTFEPTVASVAHGLDHPALQFVGHHYPKLPLYAFALARELSEDPHEPLHGVQALLRTGFEIKADGWRTKFTNRYVPMPVYVPLMAHVAAHAGRAMAEQGSDGLQELLTEYGENLDPDDAWLYGRLVEQRAGQILYGRLMQAPDQLLNILPNAFSYGLSTLVSAGHRLLIGDEPSPPAQTKSPPVPVLEDPLAVPRAIHDARMDELRQQQVLLFDAARSTTRSQLATRPQTISDLYPLPSIKPTMSFAQPYQPPQLQDEHTFRVVFGSSSIRDGQGISYGNASGFHTRGSDSDFTWGITVGGSSLVGISASIAFDTTLAGIGMASGIGASAVLVGAGLWHGFDRLRYSLLPLDKQAHQDLQKAVNHYCFYQDYKPVSKLNPKTWGSRDEKVLERREQRITLALDKMIRSHPNDVKVQSRCEAMKYAIRHGEHHEQQWKKGNYQATNDFYSTGFKSVSAQFRQQFEAGDTAQAEQIAKQLMNDFGTQPFSHVARSLTLESSHPKAAADEMSKAVTMARYFEGESQAEQKADATEYRVALEARQFEQLVRVQHATQGSTKEYCTKTIRDLTLTTSAAVNQDSLERLVFAAKYIPELRSDAAFQEQARDHVRKFADEHSDKKQALFWSAELNLRVAANKPLESDGKISDEAKQDLDQAQADVAKFMEFFDGETKVPAEAFLLAGNVALALGDSDAVTTHFTAALNNAEENRSLASQAHVGLASHLENTPETRASAIEHLAQATELDDKNLQAWQKLGNLKAAEVSRYSRHEAMECFSKAIELDPDNAFNHLARASVRYFLGEKTKALEEVNAVKHNLETQLQGNQNDIELKVKLECTEALLDRFEYADQQFVADLQFAGADIGLSILNQWAVSVSQNRTTSTAARIVAGGYRLAHLGKGHIINWARNHVDLGLRAQHPKAFPAKPGNSLATKASDGSTSLLNANNLRTMVMVGNIALQGMQIAQDMFPEVFNDIFSDESWKETFNMGMAGGALGTDLFLLGDSLHSAIYSDPTQATLFFDVVDVNYVFAGTIAARLGVKALQGVYGRDGNKIYLQKIPLFMR